MNLKDKKRIAKDATSPITVFIGRKEVLRGHCNDPAECVLAQAIRARFGDMLEGWQVGSSITKIYVSGYEIRYATPNKIRLQIPVFDETGKWSLPEGEYTLNPPGKSMKLGAPRGNRWKEKFSKKGKPGRSMFKGRAMKTRQVAVASTLRSTP